MAELDPSEVERVRERLRAPAFSDPEFEALRDLVRAHPLLERATLARLDGLDAAVRRLEAFADTAAELQAARARLDGLDGRLGKLEAWRNTLIGAGVVIGALLAWIELWPLVRDAWDLAAGG